MFGTGAKLRTLNTSTFSPFSGSTAPLADSIKILGVILDKELNMRDQVNSVVSNCSYHLRALRHIRPCLTTSTATTIACSLIQTRLDYCNSLYIGTSDRNIARLQRIQNAAAKVVCRVSRRAPSIPLLCRLHWLPVRSRIRYKIAVITYQALNTGLPNYLTELVTLNTASRSLRSNDNVLLSVPKCNLTSAAPSFSVAAPNVWNNLSVQTKRAETLNIFRKLLKTELFTDLSND